MTLRQRIPHIRRHQKRLITQKLQVLLTESVVADASDEATAGLDARERQRRYKTAAIALNELVLSQTGQQELAGVETLKRALSLAEHGGDRKVKGDAHYNLGMAYLSLNTVQGPRFRRARSPRARGCAGDAESPAKPMLR